VLAFFSTVPPVTLCYTAEENPQTVIHDPSRCGYICCWLACGRVEPARKVGDVSGQVHQFCGACHAYPPAETFPRWAWKEEVERGYVVPGQVFLP